MQDGLHIGLAAWIHGRRETAGGFPSWPAVPFATELVHLESLRDAEDLAKAEEFSRMVNFTPRKGQFAEPFPSVGIMWEVHRRLLGRMVFALQAWDAAEDLEFREARAKLYVEQEAGFLVLTPAFQIYEELRISYEDLQSTGASPAELASALASWAIQGHKSEIELALATVNRLVQRSSLVRAQAEHFGLDPIALAASSVSSYAATYYSPLSAQSRTSWLRAEVSFDELNRAVSASQPKGKWTAWLTARQGTVKFRYAVLHIHRSWFTSSLYDADDWRLDDDGVASKGDGADGELPAYVSSVYLVTVEEVKAQSKNKTFTATLVPDTIWLRKKSTPKSLSRRGLSTLIARPLRVPIASSQPRFGVVRGTAPQVVSRPQLTTSFDHPTLAPIERPFSIPIGLTKINRMTLDKLTNRLSVAHRLIATRTEADSSPSQADGQSGTSYVVGFGCTKVPASPLPNSEYTWSS